MRVSQTIEGVDRVVQEVLGEAGSIEVQSRGIGRVGRSLVGKVRRGMGVVGDDEEVRIDMIIPRVVAVAVVMVAMGDEGNRLDATLTIASVIGIEGTKIDGRGGWTMRRRRGM